MIEDALFLGVVQIVVYNRRGDDAVLVSCLMLIGVDSAESLVETLARGQRVAAVVGRVWGSASCSSPASAVLPPAVSAGLAQANAGGNVQGFWRR